MKLPVMIAVPSKLPTINRTVSVGLRAALRSAKRRCTGRRRNCHPTASSATARMTRSGGSEEGLIAAVWRLGGRPVDGAVPHLDQPACHLTDRGIVRNDHQCQPIGVELAEQIHYR